jgi:hypothetical protein
MPRNGSVSKLPIVARDDENDTQLFDRWQEHVLLHCPNPDRIGCFDHETLRTFVETPGKLDLADPKYIHITQCAECTRELQQLRGLREERLRQKATQDNKQSFLHWRLSAAVAASIALAVFLAGWGWKRHIASRAESAAQLASVTTTVDLSTNGASRDASQDPSMAAVLLPRRLVQLRLILPYYSPVGTYRITVVKDRRDDGIKAEGSGVAVAKGARTEVQVKLDLRQIAPGPYYLGTALEGDGAPYYYALTLNQ